MSLYDLTVKNTRQEDVSLADYNGKVLLIVNTATGCGFTPQYTGLQKLYDTYRGQGFEVLDFPCNQFANQAPGTDDEIANFCTVNFGTKFPRFAKVEVNGPGASPLFDYLKKETRGFLGSAIKWNFTKFLVDREGKVVARFAPADPPEKLEETIKELLGK